MDAQNNSAENVPDAGIGRDNTRWRLILLVLCVVGAGLVIGILALQVTEYLFYKAPPNVWPQSGAGGTFSAPATLSAPLSPVTTTTSSAAPTSVSAPASPTGQTSTPVAVSTSARHR